MTTFDSILEEAGPFGRFQKRTFLLLCLVSVPFAGVYVGVVFLGFTPEHWCRNPEVKQVQDLCNWTPDKTLRLTVPFLNTSSGVAYSQCERFDVKLNITEFSCDDLEDEIIDTRLPTSACKDGWDYDYEGRESFVTEFNMVCEDAWLLDLCQAVLCMGFFVGSIAVGYLADRFGRKSIFLVTCVLNTVTGVLVAISPNYISLLVFRALHGFGTKGGWTVAFVLITELVGVKYRRPAAVIYQLVYSIGALFMPLLAYYIRHWRWLQLAFIAPYLVFLTYYWFIPESPRWLLSQNKHSEAVKITKKMAKENKKMLSKNIETLTEDSTDCARASFMDLVRTPKMRRHTFILSYSWFTSAVVYQGLVMRLGILDGNVYLDFFISALVEFPAAFLVLLTIDRIGRRLPFATSCIVSGAACLITACIPESLFWLKTAVACIGRLGITMAFEIVVFVNIELYPTFIRNLGISICSTLCDVGGIVTPFLLYRLAVIWLELPLIIFGILALIAGGLALLLPETRGMPLPETIDDIENPHKNKEDNEKSHQMENLKNFKETNSY